MQAESLWSRGHSHIYGVVVVQNHYDSSHLQTGKLSADIWKALMRITSFTELVHLFQC